MKITLKDPKAFDYYAGDILEPMKDAPVVFKILPYIDSEDKYIENYSGDIPSLNELPILRTDNLRVQPAHAYTFPRYDGHLDPAILFPTSRTIRTCLEIINRDFSNKAILEVFHNKYHWEPISLLQKPRQSILEVPDDSFMQACFLLLLRVWCITNEICVTRKRKNIEKSEDNYGWVMDLSKYFFKKDKEILRFNRTTGGVDTVGPYSVPSLNSPKYLPQILNLIFRFDDFFSEVASVYQKGGISEIERALFVELYLCRHLDFWKFLEVEE